MLCALRFFSSVCSWLLAFEPKRSSRRDIPGSVFYPPGAAVRIWTHSDKVFASLAMWRDKTSPLSTDGRRGMKTGFRSLRLNCST